jgi:mannose-6-phosphate isomerase-like protein (cupin superfamily)
MDLFDLPKLLAQRPAGHNYFELIRISAMSAGLYVLQVGEPDRQGPHQEDELYYVVRGRGMIRVGEDNQPIAPGTVVFVPAGVEHHFHAVREELQVFVVFAPAETSTGT